ncbi:hypothetical protein GKQ23_02240 [Erwinia sp. E602]|uniref:hypothetical protein n=1 Tax=unclassified Erwinia TaxID=2622719 RepID=UPI0007017069|nr:MULTISPECIES: hypothetical protein [unclassified Erwinia]KQN64124.1 hypothetical protein ASF13_17865 [Erwinia sp. Leaf53]PLV57820.1 hypothetical protein NV64_15340 [Erwinia sp. B116]QUG73896.1 hypothetical protein GKQ23_02240 [Erwinia sp. E602]
MTTLSYKEIKKTDRYEILALLREAMKKSGSVEFLVQGRTLSCQFLHIDTQVFSISRMEELQSVTMPVEVVIKGSSEKIAFTTFQIVEKEAPDSLTFNFPAEIIVTQRRSDIRITIPERYNFICEGRFRDGFSHRLRVKDLSRNGIGLQYEEALPELTRAGMLLKNMLVDFGNLGQFTMDLTVLSIKEITELSPENREHSYHIFSCAFHKPASGFLRKMEETVMGIMLEEKRMRRLR